MSVSFTRRAMLTGLAAVASSPALAQAPIPFLPPRLRPDWRSPDAARLLIDGFDLRGQTVCAVGDVASGKLLESVDGDTALPPASVAKAVTALYALDRLGPEHRFTTRVMARGEISNGILEGDLILAGGGDPLLSTDGLATLAANLKAEGLRELRGRFLVWDGALPYVSEIDSGQPDHVSYSPSVSGISLNFNRVHFEWVRGATGYTVTMDARTQRYRPEVATATMRVTARDLPVYDYHSRAQVDHWSVARSALGDGGARWLPVRRPALYAGDVFRTLTRAHGLVLPAAEVTRDLPDGAETITLVNSPPLPEVLQGMLKYSTNLTAEMVGMAATAADGQVPNSLGASARAMSDWAQARGGDGMEFVDHSGLGGLSRVSPDSLVRLLAAAGRDGALRPLLKPFQATEAREQDPTISVDAKTGTLNFVSGLGGFVSTVDGRDLAFAIFSADLATRNQLGPDDRERPRGARSWNRRARELQRALLRRWATVYSSEQNPT